MWTFYCCRKFNHHLYAIDPHFDHARIIMFCSRPYENVEQMNQSIIDKWNARVTKDDHAYILGDICMSVSGFVKYLQMLNGVKHIILGNHDPKNIEKQKIPGVFFHDLIHRVKEGGDSVILCHYPIHEWPNYYRGAYHFYGHVHGTRLSHHEKAFEVCCDVLNFEPKTFKEIISMEKPTKILNESPHLPEDQPMPD